MVAALKPFGRALSRPRALTTASVPRIASVRSSVPDVTDHNVEPLPRHDLRGVANEGDDDPTTATGLSRRQRPLRHPHPRTIETREPSKPPQPAAVEEFHRLVTTPFRSVFRRGVEDGTFREGLEGDLLSRLFSGLVLAAVEAGLPRDLGIEPTAALIASLFLDGARRGGSPG